jgi:hypothetical protein
MLKTPFRDGTTHLVLEPRGLMARRLRRVFGIEIDTCARYGGTLRIIASIEEPAAIARILSHLQRTAPQLDATGRPLGAWAPPAQWRSPRRGTAT